MIAAAAGAPGPVPAAPVPVSLRAAACDLRGRDVAVRLDVGGAEVAVAVSGAGDPLQWWAAIWEVVWPAAVTGVSDLALPPGLHAVAWRDLNDELSLCVSDALRPARQRAAAGKAMRAFRGQGWRMLLPVYPAALPGAPGTSQLRRTGAARAHLAAWAALAAVLAVGAAGAYLAFAPQHRPAGAVRPPAPGRTHPGGPAAHHRASYRPGSRTAARPHGPTPRASTSDEQTRRAASPPARPSPGDRRTPSPGPVPGSPSAPAPSASPSPGRRCSVVLGVRVCLP